MFGTLDNSLFYLINKDFSNRLFDVIMPLLTLLGGREVLLAVSIIILCFGKKEIRKFGILLFFGLIVSFGIVYILKIWIARARPFLVLAHVHLLMKEGGYSFPSGHATNIFMTVSLLTVHFKKFYYFYILAFGVALSRIYVGVHFPSDVIAGALIGVIIGISLSKIKNKGITETR